ncbi:MAG TPA: phosphatase PAP2 family protein [Anaerolineales bacterium]
MVLAGLAGIVALVIALLIGAVYFRSRPFVVVPGAHLLLGRSSDPSFPSDHATVAGALAYALALESPIWAAISWLLVAAVAVARVFAGTHYPTDVLGGVLLGAGTGWVIIHLRDLLARLVEFLIDLVEQLPLLRHLSSSRTTNR